MQKIKEIISIIETSTEINDKINMLGTFKFKSGSTFYIEPKDKELIANSNFKESEIYLLMLIHEFQRSLIGGAKTPNYQVFLNKYSEWKSYAKQTDWFNYGLKLIKKFPNDRDKIKGFMIARFNRAAGAEVLTDMVFKTK